MAIGAVVIDRLPAAAALGQLQRDGPARAGRAQPARLTGPELLAYWNDLAGTDGVKSFQAIHRLAVAPAFDCFWSR